MLDRIRHAPVGVCVTSLSARTRVVRALELERFEIHEVKPQALPARVGERPRFSGFVYEPLLERGDRADRLRAMRAAAPGMPLLVYCPNVPNVGPEIAVWAGVPGSMVLLQFDAADEMERLRNHIRALIDSNPVERLLAGIQALRSSLPPKALGFTRLVLGSLCRGWLARPPTTAWVAAELGVSERTLRNGWRHDLLPPPGEHLRWLVLLYVTYTAEWAALTRRDVARVLGLSRQRLARLRGDLLPRAAREATRQAPGGFEVCFTEFVRRLGLPQERAKVALEQMAS